MTDDGSDDPFRHLRLDADFVRTAGTRELTAEERARRARQEAERLAEQEAERTAARRANRPHRRAGRVLRGVVRSKVLVWLTVIAVVGGWWWMTNRPPRPEPTPVRSGPATAAPILPGEPRPTPRAAGSATPLARPADPPTDPGVYRFLATQQASAAPVAYDPCRVIPVVLNNRTMPEGGARLVEEAFARVSALTGLQFHVEGRTDEPPAVERDEFQPARYGDRWAPVLVSWSDAAESPHLAGDTAGVAGSNWVDAGGGTSVYVTGDVTLDGPDLREVLDGRDGHTQALSIVLHEVAHLVGLDHVEDRNELMHPESTTEVVEFGPGDRRGLAQLGAGPCVPTL
ncbi:MAG TPA: matrixin family metalloprotease [Mycobacteriales bacterium]|nr:matrixin family metalloprotease [Mycobacteriales bacterium]